jgi:hypothetical protein
VSDYERCGMLVLGQPEQRAFEEFEAAHQGHALAYKTHAFTRQTVLECRTCRATINGAAEVVLT